MPKERRTHRLFLIGSRALVVYGSILSASGQMNSAQAETVRRIFAKYCFQCHSDAVQTAGVNLTVLLNVSGPAEVPDLWRRVREKIVSHLMPPPPFAGLSANEEATVTGWIDAEIGAPKSTSTLSANPGRVTARRLNRVEFNNTVRDFLGVTVHPADDFPVDNQGYGFDNIGDVLTLSPMLMEKYMAAARSVSRIAIYGEEYEKKPGIIGKLMGKSVQDDGQVSDSTLPFSIRGSLEGVYHFPVEADYLLRFRISNRRGSGPSIRPAKTEEEQRVRLEAAKNAAPPADFNIDVDGRPLLKDVVLGDQSFAYSRGPTAVKVHLTAGDHVIHAYFPDHFNLENPRVNLAQDGRRLLAADYVEIMGPYNPSLSRPVSYGNIFVCKGQDAACARRIVTSLARRGFRRHPTEPETQRLLRLVAMVRKQGDTFDEGIRIALQSILVSPAFLFRIERDPVSGAGTYRVGDYELASRLSYFLWSSMPDEELLKLAGEHRLGERSVLKAQVRRMLQDSKSANLVDDFAVQWLDLRALDRKKPDALKFPTVDDELLLAMRKETLLFIGEVFRQDRSLLDLVNGKFTYLNGPLARYYGIRPVDGPKFQRVSLEGTERGGLLTQASILTLTSYATRTSPVIRGKWVLENLLGSAPPPPPPDVPALEEKNLGSDASVRVRLEQHRANPACAVCHKQMDPIGFGLENFDAAGAWRTKEGRFDVDASGTLPDGRTFTGAGGLQNILMSQSEVFMRHLTEKMLTFALGRGLENADRSVVDQITKKVSENGNRLSVMTEAIVESEPFQMRKKEEVVHASR